MADFEAICHQTLPPSGFLGRGNSGEFYRINGGADGDRTRDLLTASQALSQLSYSPTEVWLIRYEQSSDLPPFGLIDCS